MKRTIAILMLAVFLVACAQSPTGNVVKEQQTIRIGITAPFSGDVAFIGDAVRDGITFAQERTGETKYRYEVVYEDDKLDAKTASTTTQKLISVDGVDAIISVSSGTGNVVAPLAEQNRVIHFGVASDKNVAKGTYNFLHWTPPTEEGKLWVAEAQKRGYERVAIIRLNQQGVDANVKAVYAAAEGTGLEIVSDQVFNAGETDFKTMVLKAQQAEPDIYFILAFSPELDVLYRQLLEAGVTEDISSIEAFELSNDPAQFEGRWYVNAGEPSGEFTEEFTRTYGKPPGFGGGNAYDIYNIIVQAYENAGTDPAVKPTQETVAAELMRLKDFHGAMGTLSAGEDGIIWSPASVKTIKDGKPAVLG